MNKIMTITLLFSSLSSGISADNSHFFHGKKRLSVPQRQQERREGIRRAKSDASSTSAFCSFLLGGAVAALGFVAADSQHKGELALAGVLGGIATSIVTYNAMYPGQERDALNRYSDYAPMNDELQRVLHQASSYNYNLLDVAQKVSDINTFVRTIAIEAADRNFPTLDAYNDLKAMLSYLESAQTEFKHILYHHGELSLSAETALRDLIYEAKNTQRIIKEIMVTIKVTPFYTSELEEKRRVDLYNAEIDRINAETNAASERARRERAERERARQEAERARQQANLASVETTQAWVDLFCGKPKADEIHVHI